MAVGLMTSCTTATHKKPAPTTYVALGDSYSSGEGISPFTADSNDQQGDRCHRSAGAYPSDAAAVLGFAPPLFAFHACTGARVQDFYSANAGHHAPSQLSWLNGQDSLVTVTVGGNDAHFLDTMATCVAVQICQGLWTNQVDKAILQLGDDSPTNMLSLARLYGQIRAAAPNAKIFAVGYPRFFPVTPPDQCPTGIGTTFVKDQMIWIDSEIKSIDETMRVAATAAGVAYVDAYDANRDHELCTAAPYLNNATLSRSVIASSFHPNAAGQESLARLVEAA